MKLDLVGFVSRVNYTEVEVIIPFKNIDTHHFLDFEKIKVTNFLGCLYGGKIIVLKIKELYDNSKNYFNRIEWKGNAIIAKCEIFGNISIENDEFSPSVETPPLINSEVFHAGESILNTICKGNWSYNIKIGEMAGNSNVKVFTNLSNLIGKHLGIFGRTGSGKSMTIASLLRTIFKREIFNHNNKKIDEKMTPKFIVFDYNDEYRGINKDKEIYVSNKNDSSKNQKITLSNAVASNDNSVHLTLTEIMDFFEFTPSGRTYLLSKEKEIKNFHSISELLEEGNDLSNSLSRYVEGDLRKVQKLLSYANKNSLIKITDDFITNFINDNKEALILSSKLESEEERLFFLQFTKMIYKSAAGRTQEKKSRRHVSIIIDESHRLFLGESREKYLSYTKYLDLLIREGRKYNVSIIFSTQSPSDIPILYLSQCSNFILHTIKNTRDLESIRYIQEKTADTLSIVPNLKRQEALVIGEAFNASVVVKINDTAALVNTPSDSVKTWLDEKGQPKESE